MLSTFAPFFIEPIAFVFSGLLCFNFSHLRIAVTLLTLMCSFLIEITHTGYRLPIYRTAYLESILGSIVRHIVRPQLLDRNEQLQVYRVNGGLGPAREFNVHCAVFPINLVGNHCYNLSIKTYIDSVYTAGRFSITNIYTLSNITRLKRSECRTFDRFRRPCTGCGPEYRTLQG